MQQKVTGFSGVAVPMGVPPLGGQVTLVGAPSLYFAYAVAGPATAHVPKLIVLTAASLQLAWLLQRESGIVLELGGRAD